MSPAGLDLLCMHHLPVCLPLFRGNLALKYPRTIMQRAEVLLLEESLVLLMCLIVTDFVWHYAVHIHTPQTGCKVMP